MIAIVRRVVPSSWRSALAAWRRTQADEHSGLARQIVRTPPSPGATTHFTVQLSVSQPIRRTAHSDGKIQNLRLAASRLGHVVIPSNQILSFWTLIGKPTTANGFALGRVIVADRLTAETGGGLCQISGLLYELGLRGGLRVIERYPHSRDLYTEETRFTPLGLDATVVWGAKDLRLANHTGSPLAFRFQVEETAIIGELLAPAELEPLPLDVHREDLDRQGLRRVVVSRLWPDGRREAVSRQDYVIDG